MAFPWDFDPVPSKRHPVLARLHDGFAILCWVGVVALIVGCVRIEFFRSPGTVLRDAPEPFVAGMVMLLIAFAFTFRLGAKGWRGTTQHPTLARLAPLWVLVFLGWMGMIWYDAVGHRLLHRYF